MARRSVCFRRKAIAVCKLRAAAASSFVTSACACASVCQWVCERACWRACVCLRLCWHVRRFTNGRSEKHRWLVLRTCPTGRTSRGPCACLPCASTCHPATASTDYFCLVAGTWPPYILTYIALQSGSRDYGGRPAACPLAGGTSRICAIRGRQVSDGLLLLACRKAHPFGPDRWHYCALGPWSSFAPCVPWCRRGMCM